MKHRKYKKQAAIGILIGILFISFSFKSNFFEIAKQIEIYNSLFKELNMYYVDEINPAEITNKAIKNTLKDLDPYTNFYTEQDVDDAKIRREGEYGGIGVSVYYTQKGIQIREIYKGFAADKAGLKVGDVITFADSQSLKNMDANQLSMFLKGVPNSIIDVQIARQNQTFKKQITREKVTVNPVPFFEMLDDEVGYITLTRFNDKASSEVKNAFRELKKKGMKKLIFDLRFNPGGSLFESINISNFFLEKGKTIVSTKAKLKKLSTVYRGNNEPLDLEIPIVVLINGRSASASEIVSGALQDYDRAVILGERSFGKGLVQRQKPLTYGTQLKLTISKYYTPSGRCIQELDYKNRDPKTGHVPKFSDFGINQFTTENGRIVYDGGGIEPDIKIDKSEKTAATKILLDSKAVFNFSLAYVYKNTKIETLEKFEFTNSDFQNFTKFLATDTTFVMPQERLFKEAYDATNNKNIDKEYNKLREKLATQKIEEITKNQDILTKALEEEIVKNFFYTEGLYKYKVTNDASIFEAVRILKNIEQYQQILSRN